MGRKYVLGITQAMCEVVLVTTLVAALIGAFWLLNLVDTYMRRAHVVASTPTPTLELLPPEQFTTHCVETCIDVEMLPVIESTAAGSEKPVFACHCEPGPR